jgi:hypothetical protein
VRLLPTHLEVDEMYSAFLIENDLEQDCFFVGGVDSFEIDCAKDVTRFQRAMLNQFSALYEALDKIEGLLNEQA